MLQLSSIFIAMLSVCLANAHPTKKTGCDLSSARLEFPDDQTVIADPTGAPRYIALGVGTQNYTCTDAGTY
jgi:hypothetical protein